MVASVKDYLAAQPPRQRRMLQGLCALARSTAPDAVESISYGLPTFKLRGEPLVYFAGWADFCSVYALNVARVPKRLVGSKGTIRLPLDEPIPEALLRRLIKARASEIR
jgi:uncharacterized protein YdhG (YjbR/CyaY superfamily)